MPKLRIDIITHSAGDHRAILGDYEGATWNTGESGITLTGVFATEHEVHTEFAKLEHLVAKAKAEALRRVDPAEQGVQAAQDVFAKVLEKADPTG